MIKSISLVNFKSAKSLKIKTGALTVLAGLNGSGKSTILQSLALLKQSLIGLEIRRELLLRGALLRMGKIEDVLFENAAEKEGIVFEIESDEKTIRLTSGDIPAKSDTLPVSIHGDISTLESILGEGFQFIQADRITPSLQYQEASLEEQKSGWLGCRGENTVDYLARKGSTPVSSKRLISSNDPRLSSDLLKYTTPTRNLLDQATGWLQYISPGVMIKPSLQDLSDSTSLRFSYTGTSINSNSEEYRPSNVGFGLTYSLPIVVACLAAKSGSLILLENPEAHLHPRGQFMLGRLLARCASDGLQIIVETHSDHVLNGIRVSAKMDEIHGQDVVTHFFSRDIETGESSVQSPVLYNNGRFSFWPEGFFDEWSNALDQLLEVD